MKLSNRGNGRPTQALSFHNVVRAYQMAPCALRADGRLKWTDKNSVSIARELGVSRGAVEHWLRHPERFDPVEDPIAVEQAYEAREGSWDRLTVWEKRTVARAVLRRLEGLEYQDTAVYRAALGAAWSVDPRDLDSMLQFHARPD